ncbi:MAG: class I SAM-dependent methyltransferase [Parvularculaceae bacterium]|nr:class I SAM-dependent methyltransferase [Parvularculaceae bacterium]
MVSMVAPPGRFESQGVDPQPNLYVRSPHAVYPSRSTVVFKSDRRVRAPIADIFSLGIELDRLVERFAAGDVFAGMADLRDTFQQARADFGFQRWRYEAIEVIRAHELAQFAVECPLTHRSLTKPRGYSGDAVLIDQIYGTGEQQFAPHPASVGGQIFFFILHSSACRSVRLRREVLAAEIDRACDEFSRPTILSIACGHLRELELSQSARTGKIGRLIAFDQDEESLAECAHLQSSVPIEFDAGSVRQLIGRKRRFDGVDFAYAAGLFDYLVGPVAVRLAEQMFSYLKPGGRMLIGNFTPAGEAISYMEAFMDWWLVYRTKEELAQLVATLPANEVAATEVFEDDRGVIAYVSVEKKR